MKRLSTILTVLFLAAVAAPGAWADWNADRTVYTMRSSDGQDENVEVEGTITFQSQSGTTIPTYKDCGTVFVPKNASEVLQVTLTEFDLDGQTNYVLLYDGTIEGAGHYGAGSSTGKSGYLPDGFRLRLDASMLGQSFISNSADGALSFGFHSSSAMSQHGFKMTISAVVPKDMEYVGTELTDVAPLARGASAAKLIGLNVKADGTGNPLTVDNLVVNLPASDLLTNFRLVRGAEVLAEATDGKLTATGLALSNGDNIYNVVADVAPDALGSVPCPTLAELKVAGEARTLPTATQTEISVQNIILLSAGEKTFTISEDTPFFDDGGAEGNISPDIAGVYTFVPAGEDHAIEIGCVSQSVGNGRIYVYNGRSADPEHRLGVTTGYGTTQDPDGLISEAEDGSLTIEIQGPSGTTLSGFEYTIKNHQNVDYALASLEQADNLTSETVIRGSKDLAVAKVSANISGDRGASSLGNFVFDLAGTTNVADIEGAKLVYMKGNNACSETLAEVVFTAVPADGKLSFPEAVEIDGRGEFYYFLTLDLAKTAEPGNKISVSLASAEFNGAAWTPAEASKVEKTVKAGFQGNYTIGASETADYHSFTDAVTALSEGVEGPVIFEIEDGTYTEIVNVKAIPGTSAEATVTFKSKSGDRNAVIIASEPTSMWTASDYAFQVAQTPYVTIKDMTFNLEGKNFNAGVYIDYGSHYFTLENVVMKASPVTSGYSGLNLVRAHAGYGVGENSDHMTIRNSSFSGGYIPLYLGGTSTVANPKEVGLTVTGNTVSEARGKGIYVTCEIGATITNNIVTQSTTTYNGYQGMDLYGLLEGSVVSGNKIYNTHASYSEGIYMRNESHDSKIFNNEVVITNSPSNYSYGIHVTNDSYNLEFYHNTVRLGGQGGRVFSTASSGTPKNIVVKNNIFHTDSEAAAAFYFYNDDADVSGYTIDNNIVYTASSANYVYGHAETAEELAAFLSTEGNKVAKFKYLADLDSHLSSPEEGYADPAEFTLAPIEGIETDIEGDQRPHLAVTPGAYEYKDLNAVTPALAEGYPLFGQITEYTAVVTTKWNVSGKLYSKAVLWSEEAVAPMVEEMLNQTPEEISADAEVATKLNGLQENSDYKVFFFVVSNMNAESGVVASEVFKTLRYITPLSLEMAEEPAQIALGESTVLGATVTGGDLPYSYEWKDQAGDVVSNEAAPSVTPVKPTAYTLTVTSADGQTLSGRAYVEVSGGEFLPATFEDIYLPEESKIEPNTYDFNVYSGSIGFEGMGDTYAGFSYWNGWGVSNQTSTEYTSLDDQFLSAFGGGYRSDNFGVLFGEGYKATVLNNPEGEVISGMYLTNSAYDFSSISNGDGYAKKFEQGDWFKVTVNATLADGTVGTKDFYLADYRSDNPNDWYVLNSWEWMDLSDLGAIKDFRFSFSSTDNGTWGINTPTYVCVDNIGGERDIDFTDHVTVESGTVIDLLDWFPQENDGANYRFGIETPKDGKLKFTLNHDKLKVESEDTEEITENVVVSCFHKGHTSYLALEVTKSKYSGLGGVKADLNVTVRPNPVVDHMTVTAPADRFTVEVYDLAGRLVATGEGENGTAKLYRNDWSSGVYLVRVQTTETSETVRVLVK